MLRRCFSAICVTLCTAVPLASPFCDLPHVKPDANADRASIPEVYRWNLEDLYPSEMDWATAFASAQTELARLADLHGELSQPTKLAAYLDSYAELASVGGCHDGECVREGVVVHGVLQK